MNNNIENDYINEIIENDSKKEYNIKLTKEVFRYGDSESNTYKLIENIKNRLNEETNKLKLIDINIWSKFTKSTDYTSKLCSYIKNEYNGELVTRAWTKFYDILNKYSYEIFNDYNNKVIVKSLHLCEGPGGFINALNHYLWSRYRNYIFEWIGITLNPYYEGNCTDSMIAERKFIEMYPNNWYFGINNTGNILHYDNFKNIINKYENTFMIVTCDGSVDCSKDFAHQEENVLNLIIAQSLIAINSLTVDGTLILKIFSFFNYETISLLYFISTYFGHLSFYKPITSGAGSHEKYAIFQHCLNSKYNFMEKLDKLIDKSCFDSNIHNPIKFYKNIFEPPPDWFLDQIYSANVFFVDYQLKRIRYNLNAFHNSTKLREYLTWNDARERFNKFYTEKYPILNLEMHKKLIRNYDNIILCNPKINTINNMYCLELKPFEHDIKTLLRCISCRLTLCLDYRVINYSIVGNDSVVKKLEDIASDRKNLKFLHKKVFHSLIILNIYSYMNIQPKNVSCYTLDICLKEVIEKALICAFYSCNIYDINEKSIEMDFIILYDDLLTGNRFKSRQKLLAYLFVCLSKLKEKGTLLIILDDPLSNFSIDFILILNIFFNKVILTRPKDFVYHALIIYCTGYNKMIIPQIIYSDFMSGNLLHHFCLINTKERKEIILQLKRFNEFL